MDRLFRGAIKLVALVLLLGSSLVPGAKAAVVITSCDQTIVEDAVLGNDLNCLNTENGVVFGAVPGLTLDLAGFSIDGNSANDGVRIPAGAPGATVENGTIQDFDFGVDVDADDVVLSDLTIRSNDVVGIGANGSDSLTVDKSRIFANTADGVSLDNAPLTKITNTHVSGNVEDGVQLDNSDDVAIQKTTIVGNQGHGVHFEQIGITSGLANDVVVAKSTISGNVGDGVRLGGTAGQPVLSGNTICGNDVGVHLTVNVVVSRIGKNKICGNGSFGVQVEDGTATTATKNTVTHNRDDGFRVTGGTARLTGNVSSFNGTDGFFSNVPKVAYTKNTANSNAGFGIFTSNSNDGGGNKASNNALSQCAGVVCG